MSDLNDLLAKLPEIRARRRGISPAPWQWRKPYEYADWHNLYSADGSRVHSDGSAGGEYSADIDVDDVDAAFMAAAPTDVDALLDLVDRQSAAIDKLLNDHEPHIAALEKRLAEIEAERTDDAKLTADEIAMFDALSKGQSLDEIPHRHDEDGYHPSFATQIALAEMGLIIENAEGWYITDKGLVALWRISPPDDHPRALERDATALDWEMVAVYPDGNERVDSIGDEEWIKARTAETNWRTEKRNPKLTARWIARPRGPQRIIPSPDQPRIARYAVDQRYLNSAPPNRLAGFDTENEAIKFALETSIDGTKFYLTVYDREQGRDVFKVGEGFMIDDGAGAVARNPYRLDLPMKWWHLPEFGPFMAVDTEDQRDNSYGPFDTQEEAQADWLKTIKGPPPGENEGNS